MGIFVSLRKLLNPILSVGLMMPDTQPPIDRTFVLGKPDRSGRFSVYLNKVMWRIEPGPYQAGDKVRVVAAEAMVLSVITVSP